MLRLPVVLTAALALGCSSPASTKDHASGVPQTPYAILVGGGNCMCDLCYGTFRQDMWAWDGTDWTEIHTQPVPSARMYFPMASSAASTILAGGYNGAFDTGALSDTWTWDGSAWSTLEPFSSAAFRSGAAMASLSGSVFIFGGSTGYVTCGITYLNDTWTWTGSSWSQVHSPRPLPPVRQNHAMAAIGDKVVLFGGSTQYCPHMGISGHSAMYGDTWLFDGRVWLKSAATGPQPRDAHSMAALSDSIVLFGGKDMSGTALPDTWVWDGSNWNEYHGTAPPPRYFGAMTTMGGQVVLFGGATGTYDTYGHMLGDTWIWDGTTWTERHPAHSPPARCGHAMASF